MKVRFYEIEAINEAEKFLQAFAAAGTRKTVEKRLAQVLVLSGELRRTQRAVRAVLTLLRRLEATARDQIDSKLTVEIEMKEEK